MKNRITRMRVNGMDRPLGVGGTLLFQWEYAGEQEAYRIEVTQEGKGVCDTGFVQSDSRSAAPQMALRSCTEYVWTVTLRQPDGEEVSASQHMETAFLIADDFEGSYITCDSPLTKDDSPAFLFRRDFVVDRPLEKARLYLAGLGCARAFLDGEDICPEERLLTPTTNYDRTVCYRVYDVTRLVRQGKNRLQVLCGNGFFNDATENSWDFNACPWRDTPMLKAQLRLSFTDGAAQVLCTDTSWLATDKTPVTFNNFRSGIAYDARIKPSDADFVPAIPAKAPGGELVPTQQAPVRIRKAFPPTRVWQVGDTWMFDAGVNTAGYARLRLRGQPGQKLTLSYGERLTPEGTLDNISISSHVHSHPSQVHTYVCTGGDEEWTPDFTYCGYRYIQVEGLLSPPAEDFLTMLEVCQDFPQRGEFSCSNPLLNRIFELCLHSTRTNFHWIPTDCPHREKNGWTGDAQLSCEQLLFSFDGADAYRKWLRDICDAMTDEGQLPGIVPTGGWGYSWGNGPAWDAALFVLPWNVYLFEGDVEILRQTAPYMKRYFDYLSSRAQDDIVAIGLGDWCPPDTIDAGGHQCPLAITDTAYYYSFAETLAKVCAVLGDDTQHKTYQAKADAIAQAFRKRFVDLEHTGIESGSQTAYACALYFGLIPQEYAQSFADALAKKIRENGCHHTCGILGFKYLFNVLSRYGYSDLAYEVATRTDYPSIGLWIHNGATSLYERWQETDSLNHHMYASIADWFYHSLAGITMTGPGFSDVTIAPVAPDGLDWVRCSLHTPRGELRVAWERGVDNRVHVRVDAPPSIRCTIVQPR